MKTFQDLTDNEVQEFTKYQDEVIKEYNKQNKINNILLFGIGNFGNKVVSKMKNIPNVSKLCSDINKKCLEDSSSDNDKLLFLENYPLAEGIWDTNDYADIYKQMILNEDLIIDKIQGFDYIILCTNSDDKMNSCLSEAIADTCKKLDKRFMICHSRDNFLHAVANAEGLSKQRSKEFVEKMQKKKYILNEIPSINTNFVYDQTDINYLGISCKSLIYTSIDSNVESNVNAYIFAYVLELNIMKILDNQIMNFNDCKNEFEWFLDVQYKDIDNLKDKIKEFCHNFCFDDLYDETKVNELFDDDAESKERYVELGKTTSGKIDGDDTKLARIVMFLLHRDDGNNEYAIPGLKSFSDMGSGYKYKYRGDTLNTYSTLLGSNNQGYEKFFLNFGMSDSRIAQFRRQYVTMGNFMLLPANTINLDSINTFRGKAGKYRDFFDLFMDGFINGHDFDKWKDLPETGEYFKVMNDLSSFIKINFLEDYFDMDTQAVKKNLFAHPNPNAPYHWSFTEIDQAETYRNFAINYIEKAMLIIKNRADKMSEILKGIYE